MEYMGDKKIFIKFLKLIIYLSTIYLIFLIEINLTAAIAATNNQNETFSSPSATSFKSIETLLNHLIKNNSRLMRVQSKWDSVAADFSPYHTPSSSSLSPTSHPDVHSTPAQLWTITNAATGKTRSNKYNRMHKSVHKRRKRKSIISSALDEVTTEDAISLTTTTTFSTSSIPSSSFPYSSFAVSSSPSSSISPFTSTSASTVSSSSAPPLSSSSLSPSTMSQSTLTTDEEVASSFMSTSTTTTTTNSFSATTETGNRTTETSISLTTSSITNGTTVAINKSDKLTKLISNSDSVKNNSDSPSPNPSPGPSLSSSPSEINVTNTNNIVKVNKSDTTNYNKKKSNDVRKIVLTTKSSNNNSSNNIVSVLSAPQSNDIIKNISNRYRINNVFEKSRNHKFNKSLNNRLGKVSLLGLFELSTRWGTRPEGHSELAAAQMAVRHINKRRLLPGYTLELLTNDTKCDPGVGVDRFFHALYTQHSTRMVMLLGSACSDVTESLAKVVPYWNIVQVSFGSTSPALSDRREFPLFYRTVAPDSSHNPARIAFIRRFGWDTVTTFSQNEEVHSLAVNDLVTELETANISCAATITFAETDFKNQLRMLRDLDTRIIIGSFSHELAPKIFCEAYKLGMFGADYAWILQETFGSPPWWWKSSTECSQKHLQAAVENLIIVSSHNSIVGTNVSFSGLTNSMFIEELMSLNVPQPLSRYAPQTYDAVWAIGLALQGAEERWRNDTMQPKLDKFDYTRYDMALEFLNQLGRLNFLGVSGPVSFDGADRIGTSAFYQVQKGHLKPIALYYPEEQHLDFTCPHCVGIDWKSGQVPIAKRIFKLRVATIAPLAFYVITTLATIGITMAITFLVFNLHFRKLKAIKLSSPKLSNIVAVGCILVYAAVVLLGLDYATLPATDTAFPTICTARVYLLSAGFSLAFGSMFAKTYRVHRIFTHSGGGICKDKMLQDTQLISLVCALLILDGLVVTLWVVTDPMERHLNNLTLEISSTDRSVVYQPQVEVCRSQNTQIWLGVLYIYKGLLLIMGVYMAWETRHVKISALNDSQYIGISVYSVVITSASIVVLANLLSERVTLAFIIITSFILISTTATLCLLFLPKINDILTNGDIHDPVIHSMGLKMECNTRRFVTDDRRELQYRVEVQNRVYRREVAALDAEILKLEKLLESNSSTSSSNMSVGHHLKPDFTISLEKDNKQRTPSISGTLPMLLLSVLPPVIPRASWPSAEHMQIPMRRSVTFSSEPHMDDSDGAPRLPAIDLLNLRLSHQHSAENRTGILNKIKGLFGSRAPSRKASTSSIGPSGIAAALKVHMGLLTGLVPSAGSASCNALNNTSTAAAESKALRKTSFARSGTAINSTHIEIVEPELVSNRNRRLSTAFVISNNKVETNNHYLEIETEPKVNFQLPPHRRPSIVHQNSQPTLRERVKGSPRFPHRIMPTSSLNALQDNNAESGESSNPLTVMNSGRRSSQQQITPKMKWKSMEESSFHSTTIPANININFMNNSNNNNINSVKLLNGTKTAITESSSVILPSSSSSSSLLSGTSAATIAPAPPTTDAADSTATTPQTVAASGLTTQTPKKSETTSMVSLIKPLSTAAESQLLPTTTSSSSSALILTTGTTFAAAGEGVSTGNGTIGTTTATTSTTFCADININCNKNENSNEIQILEETLLIQDSI